MVGATIGQAARDFTRSSQVSVGDLARQAANAATRELRLGTAEADGFRRRGDSPEQQRVFNAPSAALRTIDRGVENARKVVPQVEDILELARERFSESEQARQAREAEQRAEAGDRANAEPAPQPERTTPEPSPQVARFQQQAAPQPEPAPTAPADQQPARPTLNVLA